jgi:hypothetical protein
MSYSIFSCFSVCHFQYFTTEFVLSRELQNLVYCQRRFALQYCQVFLWGKWDFGAKKDIKSPKIGSNILDLTLFIYFPLFNENCCRGMMWTYIYRNVILTLLLYENCCRGVTLPSIHRNVIPTLLLYENCSGVWRGPPCPVTLFPIQLLYENCSGVWCGPLWTVTLFPIPLFNENCSRGMMRPSMYCNIIPCTIVH